MIFYLILLLLCSVSCREIHWNKTMEVIINDMDIMSLYNGSSYFDIINPDDFRLKSGEALVSYKLYEPYKIEILSYIPVNKEERQLQSTPPYSDIFGKEIKFGIFRATRKDGTCISVEQANNTIKLFDLSIRLLTGNRVKVNFGGTYFSSKCLKADYDTGSQSTFKNTVLDDGCATDNVCNRAGLDTRIIFADDNENAYPAVKGSADPGHIIYYVQHIAYVVYIKWTVDTMDPNHQQVLTTLHEIYHTVAFGHANFKKNSYTGMVRLFLFECDRYDYSNIMGYQTSWYGLPGVTHYINMLTIRGVEPYLFPTVEFNRKSVYRIFAWDFPYVKQFLLQDLPDSYMIDDIPFGRNGLSVRIPISNKTIYSKMEDPTLVKGTLALELRWNAAGQRDWKNKGIRFTPGDIIKSDTDFGFKDGRWRCTVLMDANFENDEFFESTSLPLGVTYYPKEQDIGTYYFRMLKWHPPVNIAVNDNTIRDTTLKPYTDLPYVEMEIGYFPNVEHTFSPVKTLPDPSFRFSSNVFNCEIKVDGVKKTLTCNRLTGFSWSYMVSNGLRDVNTPRIYNSDQLMEYYRFGSFGILTGGINGNYFNIRYGDDDTNIGSFFVTLTEMKDPFYYVLFNQNSVLSVIEEGKGEKELLKGNVLFANKIIIDDDLTDFVISDLYNTNIPVTVENGIIAMKVDDLQIQGFSEVFLLGRNKNKEPKSGKHFYLYQNDNIDRRVAFEYVETTADNYYVYNVRPAVIPTGGRTQPGLFQTHHITADELFIYPILFMNPSDYFYIDFKGVIAPSLTIKIETDNGNYTKDMNPFTGLNDISVLISFREINNNTGAYGQVYTFTFNQDVDILNIRPVYSWPYSNMPPKQEAGDESIHITATETYHIVSQETELSFKFTSFKSTVFGKEYSFNEEKQMYQVKKGMDEIPTVAPTTAKPEPTTTAKPTTTALPTTTEKPQPTSTSIPTTVTTSDDNDDDDNTDIDKNGEKSDSDDKKMLIIIVAAVAAALVLIIVCCVCVCCCRAKKVDRSCNKGSKETKKPKKPEPVATYVPRQTIKV